MRAVYWLTRIHEEPLEPKQSTATHPKRRNAIYNSAKIGHQIWAASPDESLNNEKNKVPINCSVDDIRFDVA